MNSKATYKQVKQGATRAPNRFLKSAAPLKLKTTPHSKYPKELTPKKRIGATSSEGRKAFPDISGFTP